METNLPPQNIPTASQPSPPPRSFRTKWILIGLAVITLLLIFVTYLIFLSTNKTAPESNKKPKSSQQSNESAWQTFNEKEFPFSFVYPTDFDIEKNNSEQIRISNNFKDKKDYFSFQIAKNKPLRNEKFQSAKEYILAEEKYWEQQEEERCKTDKPCMPMTPGFTQKFIRVPTGLFTDPNISVAEVNPYGVSKEYVLLINEKDIYTLQIESPYVSSVFFDRGNTEITNDKTAIKMIKSLKLKKTNILQNSKTFPLAVQNIEISPNNYNEIPSTISYSGRPALCQPELFDPRITKVHKKKSSGTPSEIYIPDNGQSFEMMINGWWNGENSEKIQLSAPYDFNFYEFGCASNFDFVAEVTKDGKRQALYTQIINNIPIAFSADKGYLFLVNNVKNSAGTWNLLRRVINITKNKAQHLPDIDCVSNLGIWSGNRLITYADLNDWQKNGGIESDFINKICIWDENAKPIKQIETEYLYWASANKYFLADKIGILPADQNVFYAFMEGPDKECNLYMIDLENPSNQKVFTVLKQIDNDSLTCSNSEIEFDFKELKMDSTSVRYRIKNNTNTELEWSSWQYVN